MADWRVLDSFPLLSGKQTYLRVLGHPSINRGAALDDMTTKFVCGNCRPHDGRPVSKFIFQLKSSGWILFMTKCFFPDFGDSITGTASLIVGVHNSTQ
jgi:hypothetical protein